MSLSEIISQLELNESVKFTRQLTAIRVVIKKGDHPRNNKTAAIMVDLEAIEQGNIGVLAHEVERTLHNMRNMST